MAIEAKKPILDKNLQPYSFKNPELIETAWNSEDMRQIRRQLLTGEKPEACQRCFTFEENGIISYRKNMNKLYQHSLADVLSEATDDGTMPFDLLSVDIRLGNTCNLRCRMCSPQASRALVEEWREIYPSTSPYYLDDMKNVNWFQNKDYWELLLRHIDKIQNFHFAGGEPMLIKEMYGFLHKIIATGRAPEISISYNTNGTILPTEVFDLWPHFKSIKITFSLDGTEHINRYIRYPADWNKILKNMDTLDANVDKLHLVDMGVNCTTQAYNIFDAPNYLKFMIPRFKNIYYPLLSLLFNPEHLSVQVLPKALRVQASEKLLEFQATHRSFMEQHSRAEWELRELNGHIEGVASFLLKDDADQSHLMPEFVRVTKAFDASRGQSLAQLVPELRTYLA